MSADAALTLVEALLYNATRIERPLDVVLLAVAVSAPSAVAVLLWLGRLHRVRDPLRRPRDAVDATSTG